jgi:hypothetical protein
MNSCKDDSLVENFGAENIRDVENMGDENLCNEKLCGEMIYISLRDPLGSLGLIP